MLAIVAHRRHGTNALLAARGDAVLLTPRAAVAVLGPWTVLELNGAVDFTAQYSFDGEDVFARAMDALRGSVVTAAA